MRKLLTVLAISGLMMALAAGSAFAYTYGFTNITYNSTDNATTGETQLFVDITDAGDSQALFSFWNSEDPGDPSSITQIYFENYNDILLGIESVTGSEGVEFIISADSGNLPGGNSLDPSFMEVFQAEAVSPVASSGVNPGESVDVLFNLTGTFEELIAAIEGDNLRIGFHVQAFEDGGSEAFINDLVAVVEETPDTPTETTPTTTVPSGGDDGNSAVPEPATMFLLGSGMVGLAGARRKLNKKK